MDDRLNHDVEESDAEAEVDRRLFIQRVGVGAAAVGGAWVAPSILGTSRAFAQGSGTGPGPTTTVPPTTTTDPANLLCGIIDWPVPSSNTVTNVASNITFPIVATGAPSVSLLAVNGSTSRPIPPVLVGPNPPSVTYPRGVAAGNTAINYRNLRAAHQAVQSDSGGFPGGSSAGNPGFVIAQNNQFGGNTSFSSIVNYQSVTFTLSTAVYNLRFAIRDFTATTVDPNNTDFDSWGPGGTFSFTNPWGRHRDTVGFDVPVTLTGFDGAVPINGIGTYGDPFRRSATFGSSGVPSNIYVAIPGPVTTFTIRYATVGGWGSQWIQLSDFEFGNC